MAIDAALGRLGIKEGVCTSSTRPANPFEGQLIYETDTNRTLVYDNAAWLVVADNQVLSIDSANGRVGIGDTTPSYKLDVNGDINATGDVRVNGNPVGLVHISTKTTTGGTYVEWDGDIDGSKFSNYKIIGYIDNISISAGTDIRCTVMSGGVERTTSYFWAGFSSYSGSPILNPYQGAGPSDAWRVSFADPLAGSPAVFNNLPFEIELYELPNSSIASSYKATGFIPVNPYPYFTQAGGARGLVQVDDGIKISIGSGTADIKASLYGYTQ
jgi:hypothetical protein